MRTRGRRWGEGHPAAGCGTATGIRGAATPRAASAARWGQAGRYSLGREASNLPTPCLPISDCRGSVLITVVVVSVPIMAVVFIPIVVILLKLGNHGCTAPVIADDERHWRW